MELIGAFLALAIPIIILVVIIGFLFGLGR